MKKQIAIKNRETDGVEKHVLFLTFLYGKIYYITNGTGSSAPD